MPDSPIKHELLTSICKSGEKVKIIPTGAVGPSQKRDIAMQQAKGEILAFIDDDAYPAENWLKNAEVYFNDNNVAAVGGPAVTPLEDNLRQEASGLVYSSVLVGAKFSYRYLPKTEKEVEDYPTCNLLVRKSVMQQLGGFNTFFWPGEDTKLCLDITKKLGKKIIYAPDVLAYHHRRPLFIPHLKQIASYALHRGYFVKRYPETSFKAAYFIPSVFFLCLIVGAILSGIFEPLRQVYALGVFLYLLVVAVFSFNRKICLSILIFPGIILTHFTYGLFFIKGLLSTKLKEEK